MIFNINSSFKNNNPIINTSKYISNIYSLYKESEADKILWAIAMLEYPDKKLNPKADIPRNQRLDDINSSYYILNLDSEDIKNAIKDFHKYCLSFEENMFRIQKDKLDELTVFFDNLDLDNEKDYDKYIRISKELPNIWKNFQKAKEDLLESQTNQLRAEGDTKLSKSEQKRLEKGL